MDDAVRTLYKTFQSYRIGNDFSGCPCCVDPKHSTILAKSPLQELSFENLENYSQQAISTWGTVNQFKHFLPRLLELTIQHRDDFLSLEVVFGKLSYAEWESWPSYEFRAVSCFLDDYWKIQLAEPISTVYQTSIDDVLCALSQACSSIQPFLNLWIKSDAESSRRHLAAFVLENESSLLSKKQLFSSFWDTQGQPHREVLAWLLSDEIVPYLEEAGEESLPDEFANAFPLLIAIRGALAVE